MTHVIKNTHGLAYVAFSNISRRLWSGHNTVWRILSVKEIFQVFIPAHKLLLLQRLKKFQSWTIRFDQYRSFKKNDQTAFELHCTSQNFYQRLYVLNHIVLSSSLYKFPRKALFFSLFSSKAVFFFSIYTILNKFESGTIWIDPYYPFLKSYQFLSKAHMVRITLCFPTYLETLDQDIIQY